MDPRPAVDSGPVPHSMGHVLRRGINGFDSSDDIVLLLIEMACIRINLGLCKRVNVLNNISIR